MLKNYVFARNKLTKNLNKIITGPKNIILPRNTAETYSLNKISIFTKVGNDFKIINDNISYLQSFQDHL